MLRFLDKLFIREEIERVVEEKMHTASYCHSIDLVINQKVDARVEECLRKDREERREQAEVDELLKECDLQMIREFDHYTIIGGLEERTRTGNHCYKLICKELTEVKTFLQGYHTALRKQK